MCLQDPTICPYIDRNSIHILSIPLRSFLISFSDQYLALPRGRDSSVGIATRYGLDGPGIESRWGARFSAPIQTGSGAHPASCTMGTVSFPGINQQGGIDHQPPSSAEVEERVYLYIYFPYGPSWPINGDLYLYLLFTLLFQVKYFLNVYLSRMTS